MKYTTDTYYAFYYSQVHNRINRGIFLHHLFTDAALREWDLLGISEINYLFILFQLRIYTNM